MTLGIKQPHRKSVTGTIIMMDNDDESTRASSVHDSLSLKRSNTGIILHPQPQNNPNDPLNWPIWRRDLCLLIVGVQTFLGGGQGPILAAGMNSLSDEFALPLTTISYLVGVFMLALGLGSVFASPTAVLYGKRVVYLLGILLFLVGSIVAGSAKTFGALMAGRIITGLGASPVESLPSATIAEIYFAHERAYRIGIYTMLLLGGKNIVPLLSGLVFGNLDRHWLFWILSILLGTNLLFTFLFVPETFWDRSPTPNKRSVEESEAAKTIKNYKPPEKRPNAFALRRPTSTNVLDVESLSSSINDTTFISNRHNHQTPVGLTDDVEITAAAAATPIEGPRSFKSRLALYSGRYTIDSWWMIALRPFFLYTYPSILFGSVIYSFSVIWLIIIAEIISEVFMAHGYGFDQQSIGLFYVSPFVGGILGSLSAGLISDRITRYLVSRNNGVYEPEFRLVMLLPATLFMAFGLIGFGWSSERQDVWVGPIIFFGSVSFGCSIASTTAITFTVDSYKMFAAEALVSLNFMKNFLGFVFSLFNTSFLHNEGGRITFATYGIIQIFFSLMAIPLYIYGKKIRCWTDEKEILRMLYHVDNVPKKNKDEEEDEEESDTPRSKQEPGEDSVNTSGDTLNNNVTTAIAREPNTETQSINSNEVDEVNENDDNKK